MVSWKFKRANKDIADKPANLGAAANSPSTGSDIDTANHSRLGKNRSNSNTNTGTNTNATHNANANRINTSTSDSKKKTAGQLTVSPAISNSSEPLLPQELSTLEVNTASLLYGSEGTNVNTYYKFMGANPLETNGYLAKIDSSENTTDNSIANNSSNSKNYKNHHNDNHYNNNNNNNNNESKAVSVSGSESIPKTRRSSTSIGNLLGLADSNNSKQQQQQTLLGFANGEQGGAQLAAAPANEKLDASHGAQPQNKQDTNNNSGTTTAPFSREDVNEIKQTDALEPGKISKKPSSKSLRRKSDAKKELLAEQRPALPKSKSRRKSFFGLFAGNKAQNDDSNNKKSSSDSVVPTKNLLENNADVKQNIITKAPSATEGSKSDIKESLQNSIVNENFEHVSNSNSANHKFEAENNENEKSEEASATSRLLTMKSQKSVDIDHDNQRDNIVLSPGGISPNSTNYFFAKHLAKKTNSNKQQQQQQSVNRNDTSSPVLSELSNSSHLPVTPNQDKNYEFPGNNQNFLNIDTLSTSHNNGNSDNSRKNSNNLTSNDANDFVFVSSPQSALTYNTSNSNAYRSSMIFERNVQEQPSLTLSRRNSCLLQHNKSSTSLHTNASPVNAKLVRSSTYNPSSPSAGNSGGLEFLARPQLSKSRRSSVSNFNSPPGLKAIPNHYRLDDYISPGLDSAVNANNGNSDNNRLFFGLEEETLSKGNIATTATNNDKKLLGSVNFSTNSSEVNLLSRQSRRPSIIETSLNNYLDKSMSNKNYSSSSLLIKPPIASGICSTGPPSSSGAGSGIINGSTSPTLTRRSSNLGASPFDTTDAPPLPHLPSTMSIPTQNSPRRQSLYVGLSPFQRKKSFTALSPVSPKSPITRSETTSRLERSLSELSANDVNSVATTTISGAQQTVAAATNNNQNKNYPNSSRKKSATISADESPNNEDSLLDLSSYADLLNSEISYYPGSNSEYSTGNNPHADNGDEKKANVSNRDDLHYKNEKQTPEVPGSFAAVTSNNNSSSKTADGIDDTLEDAEEENEKFFDAVNHDQSQNNAEDDDGPAKIEGKVNSDGNNGDSSDTATPQLQSLDFTRIKV